MIHDTLTELKNRIEEVTGRKLYRDPEVVEDTSNYFAIDGGMVLRLAGHDYFVTGDACEGRFGISDQPKFWVKRAIALDDGSRKIIKLVFHEQFTSKLGFVTVRCKRSPDKESAVLREVAGDARFMQGVTVRDKADNSVRIIDMIKGHSFFNVVAGLEQEHEVYYHQTLPGLLKKLVGSIEAMAFLHARGLEHGDVRNDHILVETGTGAYRWIDFDYSVNYSDYDIWSMGNILTYAVAKGIVTCKQAREGVGPKGLRCDGVAPEDALLFYGYRLANLGALFPYIHPDLNALLMGFSAGAEDFIPDFDTMAEQLTAAIAAAWP